MQLILLDFSTETRPVIICRISAENCVQNQMVVVIDEGADLDSEIVVFPKLAQR